MNKIFGNKPGILSIIVLLLLSFTIMVAPVWAEDAGDGSGGGQGVPISLVSSSPADGQKDVSLTSDIKLTFNKNVIYLTIRDNNKKCFSLAAADGSKVPIEVVMADDQINPEEKRNISINPLQDFKPGTAYALTIAPQLQGKNGDTLGKEVTVEFVTAGTAAKPAPVAPAVEPVKPAEEIKTTPGAEKTEMNGGVNAPSIKEDAAPISKKGPELEEQKAPGVENTPAEDKVKPEAENSAEKTTVEGNTQDEQKPNRTYAIVAGLILAAAAGYWQLRKRKK